MAGIRIRIPGEDGVKGIIVICAAGDRLFENRRIARHTAQAVFFDQTLELAAQNQITPDIIEPNRLALLCKLF